MRDPEREWTLLEEQQYLERYEDEVKADRQKVLDAGGLAIIGTERHESRRIDNQLRGRSGRQGDIGQSQFYISIEDDLMRRFGGDTLQNMMDKIGMDDSMPIELKMISKSLENSQKKVEARNFDIRKSVLEYDNVMNQQRTLIYKQRQDVLRGENLHEQVIFMLQSTIKNIVEHYSNVSEYVEEWDLPAMLRDLEAPLPEHGLTPDDLTKLSKDEVIPMLCQKAEAHLEGRAEAMGPAMLQALERVIILKVVDEHWMDHIDAMDQLRQGIGFQALGQQNPVTVYKNEAYIMFEDMVADIQLNVSRLIQRVEKVEAPKEKQNLVASHGGEGEGATSGGKASGSGKAAPPKKQPVHVGEKIGRNDPCPCGSGKKYKNCCGRPGQGNAEAESAE